MNTTAYTTFEARTPGVIGPEGHFKTSGPNGRNEMLDFLATTEGPWSLVEYGGTLTKPYRTFWMDGKPDQDLNG